MSRTTNRWLALMILCLGDLMIVLDTTIVNVALPSIRNSLGFTETSLVWVVNAYMLTFGGCLLLGGRLGDVFGYRRLFLIGIVLFTLASLGCGLATSQVILIVARALQGIAGAVVSAVALSLIMALFTQDDERAKAMGVFGAIASGGGAVGVFLGGILTNALSWHWIFLVNIPVGIAVALLTWVYLPKDRPTATTGRLDIMGAVTVTVALMGFVYAIVNGNHAGWMSLETLAFFAGSLVLFAFFLWWESRVSVPLMPLHLFKERNVAVSNAVGVLWTGALFGWFFIVALYLQFVMGATPLQVGLSFLPANLIMAVCSLGVSATLVMRFGIKKTMLAGLVLGGLGLAWLGRAPVDGTFWVDVFPSMCLIGIGGGIAFNPMLLAALGDVPSEESGAASGLVNTSFMMGGSVGLAILASIAAAKTGALADRGVAATVALNGGYQLAFLCAAVFSLIAIGVAAFFLRISTEKTDRPVGMPH